MVSGPKTQKFMSYNTSYKLYVKKLEVDMSEYLKIELTEREKDAFLDKIIGFVDAKKFENIYCTTVNGYDLFHASFTDDKGNRIHIYIYEFIEENPSKYLKGTTLALLSGKMKVKIAIVWGKSVTVFEVGRGPMYEKIIKILNYLKPISVQKKNTEVRRFLEQM